MNGLALCAGVGGLELGLKLAIGDGYQCLCYVEREARAAITLLERMADQTLDRAAIWDDVQSFDGRKYRGKIGILSAGIPCQPWSRAGTKQGTKDKRWLWPSVFRIIREVEPENIFLENVIGIEKGGLREITGGLASLGFASKWDRFTSEETGANHPRARIFLLARAGAEPRARHRKLESGAVFIGQKVVRNDEKATEGETSGPALADSSGLGRGSRRPRSGLQRFPFPPGPGEAMDWGRYGGPEPSIRRGSYGTAGRMDEIRAIGNSVEPLAAAHAFRTLATRAGLT